MDLAAVRAEVALKLPERYEPLSLTFYGVQSRTRGRYVVIGDAEDIEFCIDPSDGSVQLIDFEDQEPFGFVNSSLGQLARFVESYADYAGRVGRAQPEEEAVAIVPDLRERFSVIDARAIENWECWWASVLERAEDGRL